MPGEDLSDEGYAGFFGKLPITGDFLWRGLPDDFRRRWDAWLTQHVAHVAEPWPEGGLRFQLQSGRRTASGLVRPSRDSVGRRFPISAMMVTPATPAPFEVDRWCDAANPILDAAVSGGMDADALWSALEALPRSNGQEIPEKAAFLLWTVGSVPESVDAAEAGPALLRLLSSRRSSNP